MKLIAAGGDFTLTSEFSRPVQYQVDVTKDLLLIYNTNSLDSSNVCTYYLEHRPMVSGANVLGIGCSTDEITDFAGFTNQILAPVQGWLAANPTKHPQYMILFPAIPSRVHLSNSPLQSVAYGLYTSLPGVPPFITSINMGLWDLTNDCIAYINKLERFGTNYAPNKLIISGSNSQSPSTNYLVDDVGHLGPGSEVWGATNGLLAAGVPAAAITYLVGAEPCIVQDTNLVCLQWQVMPHITNGVNVAGYICWGAHSTLWGGYATNGTLHWSGSSSWWAIETVESYNG